MTGISRYVPHAVVGMTAVYLLTALMPPEPKAEEMRLYEFGTLLVSEGGRLKPIDTVARNELLVLNNRRTFRTDEKGKEQSAVKWLLDTMVSNPDLFDQRPAEKHQVFRIENLEVLNLLGLEQRPLWWRYSVAEIAPKFKELHERALHAEGVPEKKRNLVEQKVLELREHLERYMRLAQWRSPLVVPPREGEETWRDLLTAMHDARSRGERNPATMAFLEMLLAYSKDDAKGFNAALAKYQKETARHYPDAAKDARVEALYNHFEPFSQCAALYFGVFVLACVSWVAFGQPLGRAAFWLALLTFGVHTAALLVRMYLHGRPPVTNLYASAVFIGWGCVGLALLLEAIYRNGIGTVVGAALGFPTMLIALHLASTGETMESPIAVLNTNFWLATHVTIVTLGYVATFVAAALGLAYVALGVLTRNLDRDRQRSLSQMIYGVLCFALFLSFVGTVLGGIWADQSWGRFWGWDPKENGALLIVLVNALILHARWGGLVKQRGIAVLSIVGAMVTVWSWFGTNQLGVGLHAYGFNNTLVKVCNGVWLFCLLGIAAGSLPLRYWRSFQPAPAGQAAAQPQRQPRGKPELGPVT